ncbi:H-NS histone family protein [Burkholderia sp. BCC1988]|uniref:H-NS histone family protein n=1 Tax=Burkholderia sp. BCC1988 TaxID=2817443 RepID=UPI002AB1953D|nr:H-NS histone family protein [Burkholderia sp. BCC1988]
MSGESLHDLLTKRAQLDAEIAMRRAATRKGVLEQIVKLMCEYEIETREIESRLSSNRVRTSRGRSVAPRFWDPKTGATWSGRGRKPRWMAGRDPEEFRLKTPGELEERTERPHGKHGS